MLLQKVYILPIIIFLWFPGTFIVTYIIAVSSEDVLPILPYISDTGTFSPQSCIFGQMLNTGSVLLGILMYVRYRQIKEICQKHVNIDSVVKLNNISVWLGVLSSFGISVVGNFQETNVFSVHVLGAFLAFGLGTAYACYQTTISFKIIPKKEKRKTKLLRAILAATCVVNTTLTSVFAGISLYQFKGTDITKWHKNDGGYGSHLASAITEWITAIALMTFILTFSGEFKEITFEEPVIHVQYYNNRRCSIVHPENVEGNRY